MSGQYDQNWTQADQDDLEAAQARQEEMDEQLELEQMREEEAEQTLWRMSCAIQDAVSLVGEERVMEYMKKHNAAVVLEAVELLQKKQ